VNKLFKALNDETRREILRLLRNKEQTAGEIAAAFDLGKPTISHHLELLRKADLITARKNGQYIIYTINTTVLDDLIEWIFTLK
jgi:DNA-binding transcriptional ArsR family regulator